MLLLACGNGGGTSDDALNAANTYTLSGTISIDTRANVDADVLNISSFIEKNNEIASPQLLTSPVTLGGYLSGTEGEYTAGSIKSYYKDTKDFYRVSLLEGQQINLSTFLASDGLDQINVAFKLYNANDLSEIDGASLIYTRSSTQSLKAPHDGIFIIELSAEDEQSSPILYTLSLSPTQTIDALVNNTILHKGARFVTGEVVVKFKDENTANNLKTANVLKSPMLNGHQLSYKKNIGKLASLYKIDTKSSDINIQFEENIKGTPHAFLLDEKWQTIQAIEALNKDSNVLFAEPNYLFEASALPVKVNDAEFRQQWGLAMIKAPAAWEAAIGEGTTIAIIDTGIDTNHLDLINNINFVDGYDFISDDRSANDNNAGPDDNPHDTGTFLHGSHVAGIAAAQGNNQIGIAGVAYGASIMPLRVLGVDNKGANSDIANAILYAAKLPNSSGQLPVNKADVINLSLGGADKPVLLESAINKALAQGVIVVAAAGNESSTNVHYPAAFEGVIAVGSINDKKKISSFSNYGSLIDVVAPGGTGLNSDLLDGFQDGILSTLFASEYTEYSGTSMSTPHVSAVAALMKSIYNDLTPNMFLDALQNGQLSDDLSYPDFYGNGLINAAKSVNWMLEYVGEPLLTATLSAYPTQLGFIDANTESTLEITNPGTGQVIVDVSSEESWIEISDYDASSVDNDTGLGKYRVKVDSSVLAPNTVNRGVISVQYSVNSTPEETVTIDVFNSKTQTTDATVGTLLVSLNRVDEVDTNLPLIQFSLIEALKGNNEYTYRFTNVPTGKYTINAGTNYDQDLSIQDLGEARGQYPVFSQAEIINVIDQNITNLDFGVQNQVFTPSYLPARTQISSDKAIGSSAKFR